MNRLAFFAVLAVVMFVALAIVEMLAGDEAFASELFETTLLALAIVAASFVAIETRQMRRERADLLNDLAPTAVDADRARKMARANIDGQSRAIQDQFKQWNLTESECDIASMMLNGMSMKEIAQSRHTSKATVRQQAAAIYPKTGFSSRAELSAYFLKDLLAPQADRIAQTEQSLRLAERKH